MDNFMDPYMDPNETITVEEARSLMVIFNELAKSCSFKRQEALDIADICYGCLNRLEEEIR